MEKLVLASQSPRRQALLTQMGLTNFEVDFIPIDETIKPGELPENYVLRMAREKAKAVARIHPDYTVIAADTAVVLDGQIFGKPENKDMAAEMLSALSGRWHEVMTGLTVISGNREQTVLEKVRILFRELTPSEIAAYIATGEPMDKAGAYGIQGRGAVLVRRIEGDYYAVMGLPVCSLWEILQNMPRKDGGLHVPEDI